MNSLGVSESEYKPVQENQAKPIRETLESSYKPTYEETKNENPYSDNMKGPVAPEIAQTLADDIKAVDSENKDLSAPAQNQKV